MYYFRGILAGSLLAGALLCAPLAYAQEAPQENLIQGGDFANASDVWSVYLDGGGKATTVVEDGVMKVKIDSAGELDYSVQVYYDGPGLLEGAKYLMNFDIASTEERKGDWRIQMNGGDYKRYAGTEAVKLGNEMEHHSYEFTMRSESDSAPRICFNLGDRGAKQGLSQHEISIDNVELYLIDDSHAIVPEPEVFASNILVNQVGYRPGDTKIAILRTASADENFDIVNTETGEAVYQGAFTKVRNGGSSKEKVAEADFSDFNQAGTYLIRTANSGDSFTFTIAEDVYDALLADALKMLTLQRCGTDLDQEIAGDYAHPACHTELATIYGTEEQIEVSGGWHDAGDYGRYTVPAAKTVADMMLAYETYPEVFEAMDVPEEYSILSEARYELEWMLKMQTEEGGVYHKVTGLNFDGVVMPEDCTEELYVLPVSVCATGDFAGAMYMAARVYKDLDPEFADRCMAAADLAFSYLEEHQKDKGYRNPSDCYTGEYGDGSSKDEYFWAVAERYKTTHDEQMLEILKGMKLSNYSLGELGWTDMSGYGLYACLTTEELGKDEALIKNILGKADGMVNAIAAESYHSPINGNYWWGSNMYVANTGMMLLISSRLAEDGAPYLEAAQNELNYLLGINTTGYSFVSGYGDFSMKHPHHRPSQSKGKAVKGMLAGGPNSGLDDPCAKNNLEGKAKANCYIDNDQSYSTNEVAIYWNSPLIYLIAGVMTELG